jgi:eukaryotic-like serine/threonine-protein kinase
MTLYGAPLDAKIVLPEDVLVFPVAELAPELRAQSAFEAEDFVITRTNARALSKIVDPEAAALIETFRTARTIVEGVIAFSGARGLDPRAVLDDAFPLLGQLLGAGLLVVSESPAAERIEPSLEPGNSVAGWVVEQAIQLLDDTEVYRVRSVQDEPAALKIVRDGHSGRVGPTLDREADLLARLEGAPVPRVLAQGRYDERPYLVLEWCEGMPVLALARRLQAAAPGERAPKLLALCVSLLRAYAALHARGIVHGDVHPNNVLATEDGGVRVLDFGLGRQLGDPGPLGHPPRGGAAFYFDPACAEAMRTKRAPPAADVAAEQYSLAVLMREMLAGRPYLDFSAEQTELLRQIVEDPPVPFVRHGVAPWGDAERVLGRALAKSPEERFPTVGAFADALERAVPAGVPGPGAEGARALLEAVLERLGPSGSAFRAFDDPAPLCSVNTGAAGVAYAMYRIASVREDAAALALADLWITRAERHADNAAAFYSRELEITPEAVGQVSLFHTPSGLACVQALICAALGESAGAAQAVERFMMRSRLPCDLLDLTLGRAGTLLGAAALLPVLSDDAAGTPAALRAFGDRVADELCQALQDLPPVGAGGPLNLGIAHGWGGVLFALLRWREVGSGAGGDAMILGRLAELAALAKPAGNGVRWAWLAGPQAADGAMPGWCNGTAGLAHLWTLAGRLFDRVDYGALATRAAWNAWEEPREFGDLCCGLAGRSYAMLDRYRHTGEAAWLARARSLADDAVQSIGRWSLRRDSLYKGEIGVALLLADLERPELSCMPMFDREP